LLADAVVQSFDDVVSGRGGEDTLNVGGCFSELEVVVDTLFEQGLTGSFDRLELLELILIFIVVETLIDHTHNTQVVGVIRVAELTLVESS